MAYSFNDIHTAKRHRLGVKKQDPAGNTYMYVQGVASGAQYDWVTIDEAGVTVRAVADAKGKVGILQAALDATTDFGWALVDGVGYGKALTAFADNAAVYLTATPGSVDDTDVAGDAVIGAIGRSALNATGAPTGTALFQLINPFTTDIAID